MRPTTDLGRIVDRGRRSNRGPKLCAGGLVVVLASSLSLGSSSAAGQEEPTIVLDRVQNIGFDRPEAWAMKYFTSLSLMTGLETPSEMRAGAVEVALEGGLVPALGAEKRRVGFIGSKVEDLNRTHIFGRGRLTVGLPNEFSLTVGVSPPVEIDGVTPKLLAIALARPVYESTRWRAGARLHGQIGTLEGDLTCPAAVAGLEDPVLNPDGCLAPSNDEARQDYLGLELSASRKFRDSRWRPHLSLHANYLDLEFQVDAKLKGVDDRTRLVTAGFTWGLSAGSGFLVNDRLRVGGELFYSPLRVVRDPLRGKQADELVNGRFLLTYSLPR